MRAGVPQPERLQLNFDSTMAAGTALAFSDPNNLLRDISNGQGGDEANTGSICRRSARMISVDQAIREEPEQD